MMLSFVLLGLLAAPAAPSPVQYYSQALATMQRLPEPAYVSFETNVNVRGMGMGQPCFEGKILWALGWGRDLEHQVSWHATYDSANGDETIRTSAGKTCSGPAQTFDRPTWRDAYAWVRYGIFSNGPDAAQTSAKPRAETPLKTIADVSVIAPGAYRVSDGGAQPCPSGSPGHVLHFAPRFDPVKHPLRDAVVETKSMRICMIRFDLGSYQAVGTGFRGDMEIDFGDIGGYWIITGGHAAMALRAVGISMKNVTVDFQYANLGFPATSTRIRLEKANFTSNR